jgi:hypothetical protein
MLKEICFLALLGLIVLGLVVRGGDWLQKQFKQLAKEWMKK